MSTNPEDAVSLTAKEVREGDRILMPDDVTWCTVEWIRTEAGSSRLFVALMEGGFIRPEPDEKLTVIRKENSDDVS